MFPTTITITVNNISDLQKVMSVLYPTTGAIEIPDKSRGATSAATQADAARSQPTAEAGAGVGAQEKTAAASVPNAASAETAQQASTAATDAPAITYKDVQTAVVAAVKAGKRSNVVALLAEFGVEHAEKLTPEQWPDALAKLKGMVA